MLWHLHVNAYTGSGLAADCRKVCTATAVSRCYWISRSLSRQRISTKIHGGGRKASASSRTKSAAQSFTGQGALLLALKQENEALRKELAKYQQVPADQVTFSSGHADDGSLEAKHNASEKPQTIGKASSAEFNIKEVEAGIDWPRPEESAAWERPARKEPWTGAPTATISSSVKDREALYIVHISAEFAPVAKVGGLGDVVTGLARACLDRGHRVEVILPYYQCLPDAGVEDLQHVSDFDVAKGSFFDGQVRTGSLRTSAFSGRIEGIPVILLRPDWAATNLFQGGRIYGGSYNETEAYLYFSRASLEFLSVSGRWPQVLHVHEWQTAAVPMLFWERYYHAGMDSARIVFTIHNLDSQGECRQDEFLVTGVPGEVFADVNKALDERTIGHNPERLCLMKGGIVYSNAVTTVSPTYAREALDGEAAGWLKSTLARPDVQAKFRGVLNGIDTALWDPMADPFLPAPFDHDQLAGKALCKRYLQMALHMEAAADRPLVAVITRLVPQKGIHLIRHAVYRTVEQNGQFVLLGSGHADGDFRAMAEGDFKGHPHVRLMIMYSESLAHLIYAAADIICVPSLYEPCGLTQLVGMRYGAVPLVRKTGGLADTVKDVDEGESGNGFTFDGVDGGSLDAALDRALERYRGDQAWWRVLVSQNMLHDSSWQGSATDYVETYKQLVAL